MRMNKSFVGDEWKFRSLITSASVSFANTALAKMSMQIPPTSPSGSIQAQRHLTTTNTKTKAQTSPITMHRANIPSEHPTVMQIAKMPRIRTRTAPRPYADIRLPHHIGRDILLHPRCSAKASVLTHVAKIVEMHPCRVCVGSYMHMHWHCDSEGI